MNAPHKIDISKGQCITSVSGQFMSRPDDQRFTSLSELRAQVDAWTVASENLTVLPKGFKAIADGDHALDVRIGNGVKVAPTHFAFGQLASVAKAPAGYLRTLPADLAARCLNNGFKAYEDLAEKGAYVMKTEGDEVALRCITSTKYGRILDRDVVDEVMKIAGNGNGDTRWKVPGVIDWGASHGIAYNPNVDITKETTTLFASDRDVFIFLVDDLHPIEVGKLANGDPDLMFRGFYVWNSEVGSRTFGVATMYLRGVCQNRCLWGVEGFTQTTFRHTAGAPNRFTKEAAPALISYADAAEGKLVNGVKAAKAAIVSKDDDDRIEFLQKLGFSKTKAQELVATSLMEEGRPPESIWDHAAAISAYARKETHQDARLDLEAVAGKLLDKVTG